MGRLSEEELRRLSREELVKLVLELQDKAGAGPKDAAPPKTRDPTSPTSPASPTSPTSPGASQRHKLQRHVSVQLPGDDEEQEGWVVLPGVDGDGPDAKGKPQPNGEPPSPQPARLERGISKVPANVAAAARLRAELAQALERDLALKPEGVLQRLMHSNFFLPDLRGQASGFHEYILSKLTAPMYQKSLEDSGVLNWCVGKDLDEKHRLHVLWTQSDGNCLLHATLLAMWGLHDTHLVGSSGQSSLRSAMSNLFADPSLAGPMRKRWQLQIARDNAWEPGGDGKNGGSLRIDLSEAQLDREWAEMVEIAGKPNAFLDSVHVLAMAHALRRPIVILASPMQRDPFGVPLTPIFFRGIYLPFECPPERCCRQPLVLCFQDSHFMAVVPLGLPSGGAAEVRLPLADGSGEELPLRFALEEELPQKWRVVETYMDIEKDVQFPSKGVTCNVAAIRQGSAHPLVEDMISQFVERGRSTFDSERAAEELKRKGDEEARARRRQDQEATDRRLAQELAQQAQQQQPQAGEEDAKVTDRFNVTLPRSSRPGDKSFFTMPQGCTEPERIDFVVPPGSYGGDVIVLTASFKVKGHCIQAVRDVTALPREAAVKLLTKTHGDPNVAAQKHFEKAFASA